MYNTSIIKIVQVYKIEKNTYFVLKMNSFFFYKHNSGISLNNNIISMVTKSKKQLIVMKN